MLLLRAGSTNMHPAGQSSRAGRPHREDRTVDTDTSESCAGARMHQRRRSAAPEASAADTRLIGEAPPERPSARRARRAPRCPWRPGAARAGCPDPPSARRCGRAAPPEPPRRSRRRSPPPAPRARPGPGRDGQAKITRVRMRCRQAPAVRSPWTGTRGGVHGAAAVTPMASRSP
jgi:hypothetical protein